VSDVKHHHDPIPTDQFERVLEEMHRFANMLDEQERHVATARGIDVVEARRCFAFSSARLQEAGFWFQQALKFARASSAEGDAKSRHKPNK
jgi:hypothetical protein